MAASLCQPVVTYMPHFDGFCYITEPYANLTMVVAAILLLADRRAFDALAGASLAVGVLFNRTVFPFGLAFIVFRALSLRDPANRTREYLLGTTTRFLVIDGGFLVPTGVTAAWHHRLRPRLAALRRARGVRSPLGRQHGVQRPLRQ